MKINQTKLKQAVESFGLYLATDKAREDTEEREERKEYFKNLFNKNFDEFAFSEIIKKLWASQIWANQEYLVSKIIRDNGIEKLKQEFKKLIFSNESPGRRYENFLESVKGMGPSMVTEILCYADPRFAGIWNEKARRALAWLEAEEIPYEKYRINGKEYDAFNLFLKEISEVLKKELKKDFDLLFVDYFLWEVWDKFSRKEEKVIHEVEKKITKGASCHDEIKDKIAAIGSWLGFQVDTEKAIGPGARVDVVWYARIANLGAVSYVFEVQDRGSVDSLILNLQKAQAAPTVQKLIVASDSEQLERIKKEISTLPESFRKATTFWEFNDVENTYQSLEQVANSMMNLKLFEE